jgi:hypothetical protein
MPTGMSHQPDNIFAGTQVVSLVEVRGTSNLLVHPRGAVGVVTRTPASVEEKRFLVRFPDGFEASLSREQFDVLKHFKDRLPGDDASQGFDLEQFIIYRCVVGSRAYGLDNDESDSDRRGIYIAPAESASSYLGLIHMLVPHRLEAVVMFRGFFDGVLDFGGDAGGAPEPGDHEGRRIEMLRLRQLEVGVRLADVFAAFGAVYLNARRRAGALADQFAGEVEVGNPGSLDAEVFHIF